MLTIIQAACLACLAFMLVACGSNSYTQTSQSAHFIVQMSLDSTRTGECNATIVVQDQKGQPTTVDELALAPVMPTMGHASPEVLAQKDGVGSYHAHGSFFLMPGSWDINMHIRRGTIAETLRFTVQVNA
ncbi:hypothetical protein EPA93_13825 [Ktedonosporobacter rubrisoli]|uniref:YtkA-like domain-containing protein n=1 Tax=Ktedonosporobacter rubrisoli TaxID=2509675 RepID=A0A4P6JP46_KTERU|nr:hypothetical protein [Ktedonosporobacter rubrisoli]QBD77025.1 hypothetical protein EPA93_13825 [Ktedonosporobacter rubrisoli]